MVLGDIVGKKFQRDKTAQLGVISLINYPMPPPPSFATMRW
jgi:hypothetical protein